MASSCKKGAYNAQTSPNSELSGLKWANTHNKCVHDSMLLANPSPNPCLMWLHYVWYRIKIGSQISTAPSLYKEEGGGYRRTCTLWGTEIAAEAEITQHQKHWCAELVTGTSESK